MASAVWFTAAITFALTTLVCHQLITYFVTKCLVGVTTFVGISNLKGRRRQGGKDSGPQMSTPKSGP
jgi:hypothetical protein